MLEQVGNAVAFYWFFSASKQGKTGLTVTVDVYRGSTSIITGGSATAIGGGLYRYVLAAGSVTSADEYLAIGKTSDATVDQQHIPALWVVGRAWVEDVDAPISSRAPYSAEVTVLSPVEPDTGDLTLLRGDDYTASSGRALPTWSNPAWTAHNLLSAISVTFKAQSRYDAAVFAHALTVIDATTVQLELTGAQTSAFAQDSYRFDLEAVLSGGEVVTLVQGELTIRADVR